MKLDKFITQLTPKTNIIDKCIPSEYTHLFEESCYSKDDFIIVELEGKEITIDFNTHISWNVVNSGGDGYNDENYDEVEDIEIEIDLINIENYNTGEQIEFDNNKESVKILESWVISQING